VTRGGTVVRTARFMSSRVLALVEHPVPRNQPGDVPPAPREVPTGTPRTAETELM
jgi:hypothetical protein